MTTTKSDLAEEIGKLEQEIWQKRERLAEMKRTLPEEPVNDYSLKNWEGGTEKLSQLFGKHSDLIVIHNMGASCPYCTLWADGFNGMTHHFNNRAAFVVVSPDSPADQKKFAQGRGWTFKMLSGEGSAFIDDMGFRSSKNGQTQVMPGFSTFHKRPDGKIVRVAKDFFGPNDPYCSVWHIFALLKDGVKDWEPKYQYR